MLIHARRKVMEVRLIKPEEAVDYLKISAASQMFSNPPPAQPAIIP